ncbi:DUF262 domain-containing protein [Sporolactobacillus nakayamae]|uniref:Uncharacterized conserved protein, contains ParB-like and HNH nuclease domains n=1 Tax=Sporolactobacillus nakayamae TaxID=269670 RepID=A0A1I2U0E5_9BACL|nr:DUF262 domain-containing protein [Sporolactobacillus nakayamae]SFG70610.1 Uncharacterized conserved protein, contains ParB-like and HNH nuclease domains [Sporolactobacillus nakayamae]
MKSDDSSIIQFLELSNSQFVVPVYQRTYSWTKINCIQLLQDIIKASDSSNKTHFMGSIVYITDENYSVTRIKKLTIIDGQQRLTTISLLLMAMANYIKAHPDEYDTTAAQLIKNYLVIDKRQNNRSEDFIPKLSLTKHDKDFYDRLIKNYPLKDLDHNIYNNYQFFCNEIKNKELDIDNLFNGIAKLWIVSISIIRSQDNPQLIFESLNSTGVKLQQSDLIRNFLLMDLKDDFQTEIYNSFWFKMEDSLQNNLSNFIRDYLTVKISKFPSKSAEYNEFKKYFSKKFERNELSIESLVKDMYKYSILYERIIKCTEKNSDINEYFISFSKLNVTVIYPFVLELYYDYTNEKLSEKYFIRILCLLESCIIRRVICTLPPNSISKIIVSLLKDIDKDSYLESAEKILLSKKGPQRFPRNEEFKDSFLYKDMYSLKNCKFILERLVNYGNREILNIESFSIEHIMPQSNNLSQKWINALGQNWEQIHTKYLHTIGNLTLTRYNGEMGKKFFTEKRDMQNGFKDSICKLNTDLVKLDTWNEHEILSRANRLYDEANLIWPIPNVELIDESYNMILDFDDDWKNIKPKSFVFMGEKHNTKDMTNLYVQVITEIYHLSPDSFYNTVTSPELISKNYISKDPESIRGTHTLSNTEYYINTNLSNESKKNYLYDLIKGVGLSEDDLTIYLKESPILSQN